MHFEIELAFLKPGLPVFFSAFVALCKIGLNSYKKFFYGRRGLLHPDGIRPPAALIIKND
ncbi:MAG TPA: hypothetical protein DCS42_10260 [Nitrospiraceae bacterium]|nr:hypothetical protein [Nitrospiraceae bacterium]